MNIIYTIVLCGEQNSVSQQLVCIRLCILLSGNTSITRRLFVVAFCCAFGLLLWLCAILSLWFFPQDLRVYSMLSILDIVGFFRAPFPKHLKHVHLFSSFVIVQLPLSFPQLSLQLGFRNCMLLLFSGILVFKHEPKLFC